MNDLFSLREVEAFAAFMRHGATTHAAEALDISQPAVSKLLRNFQEKAGFVVFRKHKQRLIPTREAHLLNAEIERSFVSLREISRAAKDIADLRTGRVNIAALPGLGLDFLPRVLSEFAANHPSVAITLNVRDSETVIEWTGRSQVDIGIATTAAIDNPSVVRRTLVSSPSTCLVPRGHRLAQLKSVAPRDLEGEEFISLGTSDTLRLELDRLCARENVRRIMKIETPIAASAIAFVAAGAGITVVDAMSALASPWQDIAILPFDPVIPTEISIYRPRQISHSEAAKLLMDALQNHVARLLSQLPRH
jgi:DNA-binding transcriptional LysR family regulator